MAKEGRSILAMILRNFIQSFKPRQITGTLIGKDYLGNKYFEIAANPGLGKKRPSRWFVPLEKDNFEQELPAEWEAWLRGRRKTPPSYEEVLKNLAISQQKKKNAAEIAANHPSGKTIDMLEQEKKGIESFPRYPDYEVMPGKPQDGEK